MLGSRNPFGVVLATVVGVPMYADIFGTIPVAEALLAKGAQLGTVSVLYDGGHHPVAALPHYAAQGGEAQAAGACSWASAWWGSFWWGICSMLFQFILDLI